MALEFIYRANRQLPHDPPGRVALFPGSWNPPTVAHLDIARVARIYADEVIWVLPRAFPHKNFDGAEFRARCEMLEAVAREIPGSSAAISDGGLYAEIAFEAREILGPRTGISLVLGRDAAERIAAWDYGTPGVFDDLVRKFGLLVAARQGEYEPAPHHRDSISTLAMESTWDDVSSTEVRRRIAAGEDWCSLVPDVIAGLVRQYYTI